MQHIEELRLQITEVDAKIIELIAARRDVVRKIGEYKRQHNLPVFDPTREALLKELHDTVCMEHDLSPDMVANVFEVLIDESRKVQKNER